MNRNLITSLVVVGALTLAACGGSDDPSEPSAGETAVNEVDAGDTDAASDASNDTSADAALDQVQQDCVAAAVGGTVVDQTELFAGAIGGMNAVYRAVSSDDVIDATIQVGPDATEAQAAADREAANLDGLPGTTASAVNGNVFFYVVDFDDAADPSADSTVAAISDCL